MASNFKILFHRNDDNLHLKLMGDFDGTSAHMLINMLRSCSHKFSTIFIHTSSLRCIIPFGQSVFQENLDFLKRDSVRLIFTGENASQLSP